MIGDPDGALQVLLHDEECPAFGAENFEGLEDLVEDNGGEADRQVVGQHHRRVGDPGAYPV